MRHRFLSAFVGLALLAAPITACTSTRQAAADVTVSATTTSPAQAKTLADAIQLTTLAENSLTIAVRNDLIPVPALEQLKILVTAVHNALKKAEDAQRSGDSPLVAAALASFNEALTALNTYKAAKGIQ